MGITVALHALAVVGLLSYAPARKALLEAAPIMVELIAPTRLEPNQPIELPKAKPLAKIVERTIEPAQIVTAAAQAPATAETQPMEARRTDLPIAAAPVESPAVIPPVFNANYLENPAPAYPALSRRLGEQGKVILRVLVNPSGAAAEVQVRSSSGHPRLDDAARDTVLRWKFVPASRAAEPVAAWVLIPISFRLEG